MVTSSTTADQQLANIEHLKQFHPLDMISDQYLTKLQKNALLVDYKKGDTLFQKPHNLSLSYYLLEGKVEVQDSKYNVRDVIAGDMHSYTALEDKLPAGAGVQASSNCRVLQVNRNLVEQLLSWSQQAEYNVVEFTPTLETKPLRVGNGGKNWMDRLLEMPLTKHLSVADIQRLFSLLEEQVVAAGETIIKVGELGDYFYILKEGSADVITHNKQTFELNCGNYFGEEALVANAVRSASVIMKSDGILGRLHKQHFNEILKKTLIKYADTDTIERLTKNTENTVLKDLTLLDVRLPAEFRHGHHPNAINVPISGLRKRLSGFDHQQQYLISDQGGSRSDLAAYLLRQAGFNAYVLKSDANLKGYAGQSKQSIVA